MKNVSKFLRQLADKLEANNCIVENITTNNTPIEANVFGEPVKTLYWERTIEIKYKEYN